MNIQANTMILPLPTDNLIKKKEEAWQVTLPIDYKSFIKKNNGSIPKEATFVCQGREYLIQRFLCILENVTDNPLGWYDIDVVESQIGERLTANLDLVGIEVLPIAEIFGGDYLCLDYRENVGGPAMCLWSHELSGEFDPYTEKIANSFSEFLELLH